MHSCISFKEQVTQTALYKEGIKEIFIKLIKLPDSCIVTNLASLHSDYSKFKNADNVTRNINCF